MRGRRWMIRLAAPAAIEEFEAILNRLEAARCPAGTLAFAYSAAKLIDAQHPEWLGASKRVFVQEAVARFIERNGGKAKDALVNMVVEIAVNRLKADPATRQTH